MVVLICISLMVSEVERFFICLYILFGEMSVQVLCPIFNQIVFLWVVFGVRLYEFLM